MFWNDPSLYTAHLPYKELGQTPFVGPQFNLPWQNIPKWVPPTPFGVLPPYYDPKMFYTPFMQPQMFNPFTQPYNVNPTLFNYYRPFIY